jgi:DNA-binding CsgD family transcriptional regulator
MAGEREIAAATARLYETVLEPERWPDALQAMCALAGAHHAITFLQRADGPGLHFLSAAGVDPHHLGMFRAAVAGPMQFLPLFRGLPQGTALREAAVMPSAAYRSEFYTDTIRPMGGHFAVVAMPFVTAETAALLAVCRPEGAGAFEDEALRRVQAVLPHAQAALRLRQRLVGAESIAAQALAALDQLALGIILVDRHGRPCFVNRRAEAIAAERDGLILARDRLSAATGTASQALQRLVGEAAAGDPSARPLHLPRPSLRRALVVRALPLGATAERRLGDGDLRAMVLVNDPERPNGLDSRLVAQALGLTPREAGVAVLLAEGLDLPAIAARLGIAVPTARTHLRSVYAKSGTGRQADLVSLVLRTQV